MGVGHFSVLGMTLLHIQSIQMVQLFYKDSEAGLNSKAAVSTHIGFTQSMADLYWLIDSLGPREASIRIFTLQKCCGFPVEGW